MDYIRRVGAARDASPAFDPKDVAKFNETFE